MRIAVCDDRGGASKVNLLDYIFIIEKMENMNCKINNT